MSNATNSSVSGAAHLRAQRQAYLERQIAVANAFQRDEWLLSLLIMVMVIGIAVYGVCQDREMSASETQRRNTQERYRSLVEQSTDGILILDDDWDIRFANQPACRMFGYSYEEIVQLSGDDTYPPEHADEPARRRQEICAGGGAWYERLALRKDGTRFLAEVIVRRLEQGGCQVVYRDITERKQAEEARLRLAAIVESSHDAIVGTDLGGIITSWNAAAERLYGYTGKEIIGQSIAQIIPQDRRQEKTDVLRRVSTGEHISDLESSCIGKGGRRFPVSLTVSPVKDVSGNIVGTSTIIRDITERQQAELSLIETNTRLAHALEELQTAQQSVVQQERLRALGTMASGIAHDFNNALAAVVGFTELLLYKPEILDDKARVKQYLEMMNTAAKDAGSVVSRLREFYRNRDRREVFTTVDLNQLVQESISLTQPKWKTQAEARGITIRAETELQTIPPVLGNAADLREVLTNLIFNAVDAMPRGGAITLRTRSHDSRVTLEVADTGTGMTEEIRRRCLEPFFTTKGDGGTGLGLSMVYGIIQRHEGAIDIRTQLHKGTTFVLTLPATGQPTAAVTETPSAPERPRAAVADTPAAPASLPSKRVLLVDDEEVIRKVLNEYLVHDGHVVELAANGKDGLDKFHNGRFDLVIVDRSMPDMSGDQVGAAIKNASPGLPVIMLTGFGGLMEAADEKPVGVDFVVSKPVTLDTLRRAMARAVGNNGHAGCTDESELDLSAHVCA